jgi:hypothetical protein
MMTTSPSDSTGPAAWTAEERAILAELESPVKIQSFIDSVPYSADPVYRSPRSVLRDRKAHCFDGALFAAAALRRLGYPPLLVDMKAVRDDDHILALFKRNGHFGAVAKSNFVGLRYREPIYRSLREIVISYFDSYYNLDREKTLRGYTVPLNLAAFDHLDWMTSDAELEQIADRLDQIRSFELMDARMIGELAPVDERTYEAGMVGVNPDGIYRG